MTARLIVLLVLCGSALAAGIFMPTTTQFIPSRVNLTMPSVMGDWTGEPGLITQRERDVLADDTEFRRMRYTNFEGDEVVVSVVLSGTDLNNSIHRPELCLPAQGWTILTNEPTSLDLPGNTPERIPMTRLTNDRSQSAENGALIRLFSLHDYVFLGATDITASHWGRNFFDIRDRTLFGVNQRWAFVTFHTSYGMHKIPPKGLPPAERKELNEELAQLTEEKVAMMTDFMQQLMPELIGPPQEKEVPDEPATLEGEGDDGATVAPPMTASAD